MVLFSGDTCGVPGYYKSASFRRLYEGWDYLEIYLIGLQVMICLFNLCLSDAMALVLGWHT